MDRPLISVVINNYNYGRFLGEAIDSALNQAYPHVEVIVVDDGSTDNSREVIAAYGNQIIPLLKKTAVRLRPLMQVLRKAAVRSFVFWIQMIFFFQTRFRR